MISIIYYSIAIAFIPILIIGIILLYINIRKLIGIYSSQKYEHIDPINFEMIPLIPIRTGLKLEKSEHSLVVFDVSKIYQTSMSKMYTGATVSGIKLPGANLGYQQKKFSMKRDWTSYGETRITITNVNIRINAYDSPVNWVYQVHELEELRLTDYGNTVYVRVEGKNPFKIKFKNIEETLYFINSLWTIKNNGYQYYFPGKINKKVCDSYQVKAITKWDIKRLKKEYKNFPELKDKTWTEVSRQKMAENVNKKFGLQDKPDDTELKYFRKNGKNYFSFSQRKRDREKWEVKSNDEE